jgi:outer membrane protein assembly factor BamB
MKKAILFLTLLATTSLMFSQDNSQWRGPERTGVYPETNLLTEWPENGPDLVWEFNELGIGYTSVSIANNTIFTTGTIDSTSYIFAFDMEGDLKWKKAYGKAWTVNFPGVRSTPLIENNKGYVLSGEGEVVCFNTENGEKIWSKNYYNDFGAQSIRFGITENFIIYNEKLICTPGGMEDNIVALNKDNGELIWTSKVLSEASAYGSHQIAEINGINCLLAITSKSLNCLNIETGEVYWSHDLKYPHGIHANVPIYKDGYIFAMNGWEHGSVMMKINETNTGVEEVWRSTLFDLEHGDVIVMHNNIYGADYMTKHFSCVDWFTGEVKDSIKQLAPATVIAAEGLIYCHDYKGNLALLKPLPDGFEIISSFKVPGEKRDHIAHPVIHNKKLYVRYANSLWVYDIKNKS